MIFISSIFGYMVLLIIIKWCSSYTASGTAYKVSEPLFQVNCINWLYTLQAPNILTTSINMFINPSENVTALKETTEPLLFSLEFQVIILFSQNAIYVFINGLSNCFNIFWCFWL